MNISSSISKLLGGQNQRTFTDSDLDLLEAKLRRSVIKTEKNSLEVLSNSNINSTEDYHLSSQLISSVEMPGGGKVIDVRGADGRLQRRIEYSRDRLLQYIQSPMSILPPANIKEMVLHMPEILAPFPVRHGSEQQP